ncbi:MAG: hypothetical protein ABSA01_04370 [Anaerolineales bacterium]
MRRSSWIRTSPEFLPALVGLVDRVKKGHRVGHEDDDQQAQFPGALPDLYQVRVVHIHQAIVLVADGQAETLPDFQPFRAAFLLDPQPPGGLFGKTVAFFQPLRSVHPAEDQEAPGRGLLEMVEVGIQHLLTPAAVQIHVEDDPGLVQPVQQFRQGFPVPPAAELPAHVVVGVEGREARLFHPGDPGDQFGLRAEGFEFHGLSKHTVRQG